MAAFRQIGKTFRAEVRKRGIYFSASFSTMDEAELWAAEREREIVTAAKLGQLATMAASASPRMQAAQIKFSDTLTEAEIVMASRPHSPLCGVYFLVRRGQVVYVGSSVDVNARLTQHRMNKREFDAVHVIECAGPALRVTEAKYILALRPTLNHGLDGALVVPMRKHEMTRLRNAAA